MAKINEVCSEMYIVLSGIPRERMWYMQRQNKKSMERR
jgi:hypothetical protein